MSKHVDLGQIAHHRAGKRQLEVKLYLKMGHTVRRAALLVHLHNCHHHDAVDIVPGRQARSALHPGRLHFYPACDVDAEAADLAQHTKNQQEQLSFLAEPV